MDEPDASPGWLQPRTTSPTRILPNVRANMAVSQRVFDQINGRRNWDPALPEAGGIVLSWQVKKSGFRMVGISRHHEHHPNADRLCYRNGSGAR
jgi:hypothetical protein